MTEYGKVSLVGAGPGDRGLITLKGMDCVRQADVIIYDSLISASILNEARLDAELIYAGKRSSHHHLRQEETNALLVEKAKEGKYVVRLKGGDPFIFGRGGEEAAELAGNGIPFEIVPGISSSYSAAAYAGIPVTERGTASSFHVITGHESDEKGVNVIHYDTLAREEGTLVFLMGLANLPIIAKELIRNGKPADTPAAVIGNGTTARQQVCVGTLADIAGKVVGTEDRRPGRNGDRQRCEPPGNHPLVRRPAAVRKADPDYRDQGDGCRNDAGPGSAGR
jgi:uroporphyrinogen III methyltransferase/synthase